MRAKSHSAVFGLSGLVLAITSSLLAAPAGAAPEPAEFESTITVDPLTATVFTRGGGNPGVAVTGTVSCTGPSVAVLLGAELRQGKITRTSASGLPASFDQEEHDEAPDEYVVDSGRPVPCDGEVYPWELGFNGADLTAGKAKITASLGDVAKRGNKVTEIKTIEQTITLDVKDLPPVSHDRDW
uniref:hypothetical protein n=1 Tax=Nocardia suismassiliense TaxID=2077092 RepID=UPI003F497517